MTVTGRWCHRDTLQYWRFCAVFQLLFYIVMLVKPVAYTQRCIAGHLLPARPAVIPQVFKFHDAAVAFIRIPANTPRYNRVFEITQLCYNTGEIIPEPGVDLPDSIIFPVVVITGVKSAVDKLVFVRSPR